MYSVFFSVRLNHLCVLHQFQFVFRFLCRETIAEICDTHLTNEKNNTPFPTAQPFTVFHRILLSNRQLKSKYIFLSIFNCNRTYLSHSSIRIQFASAAIRNKRIKIKICGNTQNRIGAKSLVQNHIRNSTCNRFLLSSPPSVLGTSINRICTCIYLFKVTLTAQMRDCGFQFNGSKTLSRLPFSSRNIQASRVSLHQVGAMATDSNPSVCCFSRHVSRIGSPIS